MAYTITELSMFKYAPITSCDVEISFSQYKAIFRPNRQSFNFDNLKKHVIVYCNQFHDKANVKLLFFVEIKISLLFIDFLNVTVSMYVTSDSFLTIKQCLIIKSIVILYSLFVIFSSIFYVHN